MVIAPGMTFVPGQHRFAGSYTPESLEKYPGLSDAAKLLWARLARYAGQNGRCFPSQERLSEDLAKKPRQIRNLIAELVRKGFLQVDTPSLSERAKGRTAHYRFLMHSALGEIVSQSLPTSDVGQDSHRQEIAYGERQNSVAPAAKSGHAHRQEIAGKERKEKERNTTTTSSDQVPRTYPEKESQACGGGGNRAVLVLGEEELEYIDLRVAYMRDRGELRSPQAYRRKLIEMAKAGELDMSDLEDLKAAKQEAESEEVVVGRIRRKANPDDPTIRLTDEQVEEAVKSGADYAPGTYLTCEQFDRASPDDDDFEWEYVMGRRPKAKSPRTTTVAKQEPYRDGPPVARGIPEGYRVVYPSDDWEKPKSSDASREPRATTVAQQKALANQESARLLLADRGITDASREPRATGFQEGMTAPARPDLKPECHALDVFALSDSRDRRVAALADRLKAFAADQDVPALCLGIAKRETTLPPQVLAGDAALLNEALTRAFGVAMVTARVQARQTFTSRPARKCLDVGTM